MSNKAALLNMYEQFAKMTYDLKQLTEFNSALVSGFDPERSLTEKAQDADGAEYLLHSCLQHQDVLKAYLYAQQQILPKLRDDGFNQITEMDLLEWLDQIHLRIARTLAIDAAAAGKKGHIAGEPCKRMLIQWRVAREVEERIIAYFFSQLSLDELITFAESIGIPQKTALAFIGMLAEMKSSDPGDILASERPYVDSNSELVFMVLLTRYYNNELNATQKDLVEQIFKVFPAPSQRPVLREAFARQLLIKLKQVNANDFDQVVELAHWVFYQITKAHWYFNGNGRAATCFMNTILRALGKPSILIRHPNERDDPESAYSQAIKHIDTQPELLKRHIKQRILDYQTNGHYRNEASAKQNDLRMRLGKIRAKILRYFPSYDVATFAAELSNNERPLVEERMKKGEPQDQWIPFFLQRRINLYAELFEELARTRRKNIITEYKLNQNTNSIYIPNLDKGLRMAAALGHLDCTKLLVEELKCDVNKQDDNPENGKTPLHWAVIKKHEHIVEFLLECGARMDIPDGKAKKTALIYAEESSPAIKKLLGITQATPEPSAKNVASPSSG